MTQLTDALDEAMARAMWIEYGGLPRIWDEFISNPPKIGSEGWVSVSQYKAYARAARLALAEALAERGLKVVSEEVTYEMARAALERPSSDVARTLYEDIWPAMLPVAPDLLTEGGE